MNELQNIKLPGFLITDWYKGHLIISDETTVKSSPQPVENTVKVSEPTIENTVNVAAPPLENKQVKVEAINEPVWFTGENKKNITILINQNGTEVISEEWKIFLNSVIAACKLTLNDVVIVNTFRKAITYNQLKEKFNSQFLLVFDIAPSLLGIPAAIPNYDIRVDNNCAIVFSDSIAQMLPITPDAKQIKMKLWVSLKKLFNV